MDNVNTLSLHSFLLCSGTRHDTRDLLLYFLPMPKTKKASKKIRAPRIAILAADFNKDIVHPMIESAKKTVQTLGCVCDVVITVPGSFEIPLVLDAIMQRDDVDAVAVLGYIERGETLHGEVMGHVVYTAMTDMSLMYGKPVGLGIIGPGATLEQAKKRNISYGEAAVAAAVRSLACLEEAQS